MVLSQQESGRRLPVFYKSCQHHGRTIQLSLTKGATAESILPDSERESALSEFPDADIDALLVNSAAPLLPVPMTEKLVPKINTGKPAPLPPCPEKHMSSHVYVYVYILSCL